MGIVGKGGARGRIRTTDTRIFSPLLYQLSYLGEATRNARQTIGLYVIASALSRCAGLWKRASRGLFAGGGLIIV